MSEKKRVYLVGVIGSNPLCSTWRKDAIKLLGDKFDVDDPTSSRFDKELRKEASGDTEKLQELVSQHQAEILLPKSYQSVAQADILLINFSLEEPDRPLIGSIMELAWGFQLNKVVIAIRGTSYYSRHPMVKGCVHAWADNIEEAVEIIKEFFTTRR